MPVLLLFFASGAAALVCEVSWSRQVGLVLGNTAGAAALVLAAFFLGAALGQGIGGAVAQRVRPLFGYGVAELAAAAGAALVPALLAAIEAARLEEVATAVLVVAALLPPAAAFGATLPLVAAHFAQTGRGPERTALAYALNTAGGLLGVAASASVLLVVVGVRGSGYAAAGVSAGCGLAACALAVLGPDPRTRHLDEPPVPARAGAGWYWVAAGSGFVVLSLEVLYARLFSLVLHNSTYTFAAVVAVFLVGLSLGATAVAVLGRRLPPRALAAAGCGLGAVAVAASLVVFVRATGFEYVPPVGSFGGYLASVLGLVAGVVLPPAFLLGIVFPAVLVVPGVRPGRAAAINSVAAASGAVAAGFVLAPGAGLWGAFGACVALAGATGVTLAVGDRPGRAAAIGASAAVACVGASVGPQPADREEVVQRWESGYGWIDVTRSPADGSLRVRQNLHYRHGSTASAAREYRQGRVPLLLHPSPSDVAFLGLGTGITAAPVVADRDVCRATVVELIPEVVAAARVLGGENRGVVTAPKVKVVVADARTHLRRTPDRFDVIVSDMFVPWEARAGYLYTAEFYEAARDRLKPGGLFCQWLALYQFDRAEFEMVADTFAASFPVATIWWGQRDDRYPMVALIGSERPIGSSDPDRLAARWMASGTPPDGSDPLLRSPRDVLNLRARQWPVRPYRALNTDEYPQLEFAAPVGHATGQVLTSDRFKECLEQVVAPVNRH